MDGSIRGSQLHLLTYIGSGDSRMKRGRKHGESIKKVRKRSNVAGAKDTRRGGGGLRRKEAKGR